ncbi:MAG: diaminopimelate epimerase [Gammaproteobacteria bacterium]|nr:diaminopimelate epimerase [Gammaproteobacteria bacterium]
MLINFTKMHGLGNDFVVINAINQDISLDTEQYRFIADRHTGIGCDQILLVNQSAIDGVDFQYRIFNADGGEVEQCGNGARCFARFVVDNNLTDKQTISVETQSGLIELNVESDGNIKVDMGSPELDPLKVPFIADNQADEYEIALGENIIKMGVVSMGNPHAVIKVDSTDSADVLNLGPVLENHDRFPHRVNVGFMQIINRGTINLRVWERGVGETRACGTGACAAVVYGISQGWLEPRVIVNLQGGQLVIQWNGDNHSVMMTGPATSVFEGTIQL